MSPTRRDFLHTSSLAAASLALGAAGCSSPPRPLRLLILGGTSFIGPPQVEYALARGHEVTLFNRGRTNADLFPGVEKLIGDRRDDLSALQDRTWDAVIDNSATSPDWVRRSARLLADSVGVYLFTSTRSVISDLSRIGMTALDAPVYAFEGEWTGEDIPRMPYGLQKATCEKEVGRFFPDDHLIIRPGLIVGPRDDTDRFTYWPVRLHRGGEVLAPGEPANPVMFIDARDLSEWYIRLLEQEVRGTYMGLGPAEPLDFRGLLEGVQEGIGSEAAFTWVDTDFLLERRVAPYTDMPLWLPARGSSVGFNRFDLSREFATGITYRPLTVTARETLDWHLTRPEERRSNLRMGLKAEREAELLAEWHRRG